MEDTKMFHSDESHMFLGFLLVLFNRKHLISRPYIIHYEHIVQGI